MLADGKKKTHENRRLPSALLWVLSKLTNSETPVGRGEQPEYSRDLEGISVGNYTLVTIKTYFFARGLLR